MVAGPPDVTSAHCDTRVAAPSSGRPQPEPRRGRGPASERKPNPLRPQPENDLPRLGHGPALPQTSLPAYVASLTRGWELGSEGVRGFWGRGMIRGWRLYADRSCLEYPLCKK